MFNYLGVSNVSFGLPPVGREVLNAVYLYHCTQAGLDYAIVNTEKLERYASIPEQEIAMADEFIIHTTDQTLLISLIFIAVRKKKKQKMIFLKRFLNVLLIILLKEQKKGCSLIWKQHFRCMIRRLTLSMDR